VIALTPTDGTELVSLITFSPRERNPTEKFLAENRNPRREKVFTRLGKPTEPNLASENPSVRLREHSDTGIRNRKHKMSAKWRILKLCSSIYALGEEHDKSLVQCQTVGATEGRGRSLNSNRQSRIGITEKVGFKLTYQIEGTSGRRAITSSRTHGRCVTSARSLPDRAMSRGCTAVFNERKLFIKS